MFRSSGLSVTRQEWVFVVRVTVILLLVTGLPYLYGYLSTPPDKQFMGIALGTPDITQYFAWMRGFTRSLIIDNTLTPETNASIFFNLLWWSLAQLSRVLNLSFPLVYQILRVLAGGAFLLVAYPFCAAFLEDPRWRKMAFLVIALGSGFGWLWVVRKQFTGELEFPLDVYAVEPNSFLSIMALPHFVIAAVFLLLIFALIVLSYERVQWRFPVLAGLASLVLGLQHAYDLLLIYAILVVYTAVLLVRDGFSPHLVTYPMVIGLLSCGPAFYSAYITSSRFPVWRAVFAQFVNAGAWTPDPFHLLILLGLPFILALLTFDGLVPLEQRSHRELFIKVWFGVNLFMVYLPVNFQIHFLNGWQVPIAILATMGLSERILPWIKQAPIVGSLRSRTRVFFSEEWVERMLVAALVVIVLPTNLYLLTWRFVDLGRHRHPYYLYNDEVQALEWLEANARPDTVVLSGIEIGQYIPSRTDNRAFLAHWAMTADIYTKQRLVAQFFNPDTSDETRRAMLEDYEISYILYGTEEQEMGKANLSSMPYLETVFDSNRATVYRVHNDMLTSDRSTP
jgi:hypothetical protein